MRGHHETEAVKNRYLNAIPAPYLQSAFPEVYFDRAPGRRRSVLALWRFRRYISPDFPTKRSVARERTRADSDRSGEVPGIQ